MYWFAVMIIKYCCTGAYPGVGSDEPPQPGGPCHVWIQSWLGKLQEYCRCKLSLPVRNLYVSMGLLEVFFVSVRPTIPVPSWLFCHLPTFSKNGAILPLILVMWRLKSSQHRGGGFAPDQQGEKPPNHYFYFRLALRIRTRHILPETTPPLLKSLIRPCGSLYICMAT